MMPVHDWTRVPAGIFHDFHCTWTTHIKESLNQGVLPEGYYALTEQIVPVMRPDVIALSTTSIRKPKPQGGTAVMDPPQTKVSLTPEPLAGYRHRRRTGAVRHVSGHQIVALIESPVRQTKIEP